MKVHFFNPTIQIWRYTPQENQGNHSSDFEEILLLLEMFFLYKNVRLVIGLPILFMKSSIFVFLLPRAFDLEIVPISLNTAFTNI